MILSLVEVIYYSLTHLLCVVLPAQWAPTTSMALFVPAGVQYAGQQAPDSAMPASAAQVCGARPAAFPVCPL